MGPNEDGCLDKTAEYNNEVVDVEDDTLERLIMQTRGFLMNLNDGDFEFIFTMYDEASNFVPQGQTRMGKKNNILNC